MYPPTMLPPNQINQNGHIHTHWAGVVAPSLYRSHPVYHQPLSQQTRSIKITQPDALKKSASTSSTSSLVAPVTPTASPGNAWGLPPRPAVGPVKNGQIQMTRSGSSRSVQSPTSTPISARSATSSKHTTPAPPNLDRFAPTYMPHWLREESLPPIVQNLSLPPRAMYPDETYTATVYPPAHVTASHYLDESADSILCHPASTNRVMPLPTGPTPVLPGYYAAHFTALLSMWLDADLKRMKASTIPLVALQFTPSANASYRIVIPGIREDSPKLAIGDRVRLRGMLPDRQLASNMSTEAEVIGLNKLAGWVYVKGPHLHWIIANHPPHSRFRLNFMLSVDPFCAMQDAVRRIGFAADHQHVVARHWLFPCQEDVVISKSNDVHIEIWSDESLNPEQRRAVEQIVKKDHTVPYLISGPPGTGKTKTMVEAVLQILAHDSEATILLCAPSNPAADTLVRRLATTLQVGALLRLNSPQRTFAEVPDHVLPYCHVINDTFAMPPFTELMKYRVVVSNCRDTGMLVNGRVTNGEMMRAQRNLHKAIHPTSKRSPPPFYPHWTHLLVDEAAQASEPEVLIPIEVVLPWIDNEGRGRDGTRDPVIVLCGDVHQLGPVITSRDARDGELDVSLLERLFRRDLYSRPESNTSIHHRPSHPSPSLDSQPCTHLVRNYRSMSSILMVPAALFYNDTLIASATDVRLIKWSGLPNPRIPILFQGCESEEAWIDEGASWYNTGEINSVADIILSLRTERPDIKEQEIAVITPWKEQVWRIRTQLRTLGLRGVDVGHVEAYQGAEFRVTILSCVRSSKRFLNMDREANMGLYNEPKRFNVAITRAKELLIVVGNANLLKGDPFWNGFLQVMLRNGLYKGPEVDMEMTGAYISHIESEMRRDDVLDPDDAGLMLAGEMARDILRE